MATPLWLALLKEAASGTTPTTANDTSSGTPVNLTLTFAGSDSWTSVGSGNGVTFTAANLSRGQTADTSGTKIQTAIQGSTTITGEFVANATVGCALSLVDTGNDNQAIACFFASAGALLDCYAGSARYIFNISTGLHRYHLSVNSNAAAGSRLILYQDGSAASLNVLVSELTAASAVDNGMLWGVNSCRIGVGTFDGFSDWLTGSVYEAAIYAAALTSGQVSANQTALGTNNDADPNGGAAPVFAVDQDTSSLRRLPVRRQHDTSAQALPRQLPPLPWVDRQFEYVRPSAMRGARLATSGLPVSAVIAAPVLAGWNPAPSTLLPACVARPALQTATAVTFPASAVAPPTKWVPATAPLLSQVQPLRMPRNSGGIPTIAPWLQDVAPSTRGALPIRADSAVGIRPMSAPVLSPWTERQNEYLHPVYQSALRATSAAPTGAIQASPGLAAWAQDVTTIVPARAAMRADSALPAVSAPASMAWVSDGQSVQRQQRPTRSELQPSGVLPSIAGIFRGVLDNPVVRWFRSKFQPASAEVLAPLIPVIIPPFEPGPLDISPVDVVLTIWEANV